jgi:hypothetical protein
MPASVKAAAFLLLLAGAVVAALFTAVLAAAALGWSFSPLESLGLPIEHGARAWLLVACVVALAVLMWLVLRADQETVRLAVDGGHVVVAVAALERAAERAAARHPEVVRAEARLRMRRGLLGGKVRAFCRPMSDSASIRGDVSMLVSAELAAATGTELGEIAVRPRVLGVGQLKRHLP